MWFPAWRPQAITASLRIRTKSSHSAIPTLLRAIHTRREPVKMPETTTMTVLDFPPQPRPTRPLSALMRKAKTLVFTGPKGEIVVPLHHFVNTNWGEDAETKLRTISFSIEDENSKLQRGIWGLTRALCANAIKGVEEGHEVSLRLVGVGYRASVEPDPLPRKHPLEVELERGRGHWYAADQKQTEIDRAKRLVESSGQNERLNLRLGYSHPVLIPIPYGIKAQTPSPTVIKLTSANKENLGQFAQTIRQYRKPEPYKGKGIFIGDEQIKLKTPKKK
ncbi:54S ribosomal protein L6 mitochondrial [Malassezia pachydermatis]